MTAESALSGRHFQEGIGREPATEMERSGIEVRSTASVREAGARDRDGAKRNRGAQHGIRQGGREPATEMERSGIEVRSRRCIRRK